MYGDAWAYTLPMGALLGATLREGFIPLWNPYVFGGMPFLAALQAGVLFPLNWLFAFLPPPVALNVVVILTYYAGLIGTYLYGRRLNMTRTGALVSAAAFTFGAFMITEYDQTNYIAALVWLPWILLALEQVYESVSLQNAFLWILSGAVFIALTVFAGFPQACFQIALIVAPYAVFRFFSTVDRTHAWRYVIGLAVMLASGVLISSIQLLPARELQLRGDRIGITYEYFSMWPMPPGHLWSFVFPFFFGGGAEPLYKLRAWDAIWAVRWAHGYVGMAGLMLAFVAIASIFKRSGNGDQDRLRRRMMIFWLCTAILSLVLSFGSHLPFNLNRLLFQIPVYNLFRASLRHLFEYSFAISILAGMGLSALSRWPVKEARRCLLTGISLVFIVNVFALVAFRFFAPRFSADDSAAIPSRSIAAPEVIVPFVFFLLTTVALWFSVLERIARVAVITVLMLDLMCFGYFTQWRPVPRTSVKSFSDSPAVEFVKSREADLKSFRVLDQTLENYSRDCDALNCQNISILRGLQSAGGYEPMRLSRVSTIAGGMSIGGKPRDPSVFGSPDQSLNLLNVKYLFRELPLEEDQSVFSLRLDGSPFKKDVIGLSLVPGQERGFDLHRENATELLVVSTLSNSASVPDGEKVGEITVHFRKGTRSEFELLAGRDTAEWAWDRDDVRKVVRHSKGPVIESFDAGGFDAHRYLARFRFDRSETQSIVFRNTHPTAGLVIERVSLLDSVTGRASSLAGEQLPQSRWQRMAEFGGVEVLENLQVLPRAWFVSSVELLPGDNVLQAIKTGRIRDGVPFTPASVALLDTEQSARTEFEQLKVLHGGNSRGSVTPISYSPNQIELNVNCDQPGFLVLSEVYYPGWTAFIDNDKNPATIFRTNYSLRGLIVPQGSHRVSMKFHPASAYYGLWLALAGVALLAAFGIAVRKITRAGPQSYSPQRRRERRDAAERPQTKNTTK